LTRKFVAFEIEKTLQNAGGKFKVYSKNVKNLKM
jgi:hypothetical protein